MRGLCCHGFAFDGPDGGFCCGSVVEGGRLGRWRGRKEGERVDVREDVSWLLDLECLAHKSEHVVLG